MSYDRVTAVARLRDSKDYKKTMDAVEKALTKNISEYKIRGPVEADPEYSLVVDVNKLAVEVTIWR